MSEDETRGMTHLTSQLSLWIGRLDTACDELILRYGDGVITQARRLR
ncbi:MAG: hypothetical protein GX358_09730 [candidate division WS1 bacterium]|jgi:hypothetical protein|nr:hypothetical protein [candidate division WS1 bacterium]